MLNWIIQNNLGLRNLHPAYASYLRGKQLVEARLRDIQRWAGKGVKPIAIAKRLRTESVTGAYLNGLLGGELWWPTRRRP